jgi:uncharacterized protein
LRSSDATPLEVPVTADSIQTEHSEQQQVAAFLARTIRKRLWVVIAHVNADADAIEPHVMEHLNYMAKLEVEGKLWASGPFVVPGVLVGDGLTILRADTEAEARALIDEEPLTKLNLRTYELRLWELREGRITIEFNASASSAALP